MRKDSPLTASPKPQIPIPLNPEFRNHLALGRLHCSSSPTVSKPQALYVENSHSDMKNISFCMSCGHSSDRRKLERLEQTPNTPISKMPETTQQPRPQVRPVREILAICGLTSAQGGTCKHSARGVGHKLYQCQFLRSSSPSYRSRLWAARPSHAYCLSTNDYS